MNRSEIVNILSKHAATVISPETRESRDAQIENWQKL